MREKDNRDKWHSYPMLVHDITVDADNGDLIEVTFVSFIHCKLILSHPFPYATLEQSCMYSPHLEVGGYTTFPSEINYFELICIGYWPILPNLFCFLTINIYISMDSWNPLVVHCALIAKDSYSSKKFPF